MYWESFFISSAICAIPHVLAYLKGRQEATAQGQKQQDSKPSTSAAASKQFVKFQRNYLLVYLLAMFADWLQGPYVYALYSSYGFTPSQIATLFVMGFGSSMFVGTFVGTLSDKYGRKTMCLMFAVLYILSALTKLVQNYAVLFLGRFLSGVATSLLFSAFEAWMVSEHNKNGFDPALLSDTFSKATTYNGVIAVVAGLVASWLADRFGYVAPFVFAIIPLILLSTIVLSTWTENYGNSSLDIVQTFSSAIKVLRADTKILLLGASQSLFEGSMYTFVFLWSPALTAATALPGDTKNSKLPFGLIFAVFMVCIMIGSAGFDYLIKQYPAQRISFILHAIASLAFLGSSWCLDMPGPLYLFFLIFEGTCGMFWPTYGTIRSVMIPEANRAAISTFFRIPLNLFVVLIMLNLESMTHKTVLLICWAAQTISLLICTYIFYFNASHPKQEGAVTAATKKKTSKKN